MISPNQDLNIKEVQVAKWLQINKPLIKKAGILILILAMVIIWVISLYHIVTYFVYSPNYRETINGLAKNWVDYLTYNERVSPVAPEIITHQPSYYLGSDNLYHYSLIVEVNNKNKDWIISDIAGQFTLGDKAIPVHGFVLPGERKYLLSLNQTNRQVLTAAPFEIKNITWQRVRPDWREQLLIINQFSFQKINFTPAEMVAGQNIPARVGFEVTNNSIYSFWQGRFQIIIYQGDKIIDAYVVSNQNWLTDQTKKIEINLTQPLTYVTQVKVISDINILDTNNFIKSF